MIRTVWEKIGPAGQGIVHGILIAAVLFAIAPLMIWLFGKWWDVFFSVVKP